MKVNLDLKFTLLFQVFSLSSFTQTQPIISIIWFLLSFFLFLSNPQKKTLLSTPYDLWPLFLTLIYIKNSFFMFIFVLILFFQILFLIFKLFSKNSDFFPKIFLQIILLNFSFNSIYFPHWIQLKSLNTDLLFLAFLINDILQLEIKNKISYIFVKQEKNSQKKNFFFFSFLYFCFFKKNKQKTFIFFLIFSFIQFQVLIQFVSIDGISILKLIFSIFYLFLLLQTIVVLFTQILAIKFVAFPLEFLAKQNWKKISFEFLFGRNSRALFFIKIFSVILIMSTISIFLFHLKNIICYLRIYMVFRQYSNINKMLAFISLSKPFISSTLLIENQEKTLAKNERKILINIILKCRYFCTSIAINCLETMILIILERLLISKQIPFESNFISQENKKIWIRFFLDHEFIQLINILSFLSNLVIFIIATSTLQILPSFSRAIFIDSKKQEDSQVAIRKSFKKRQFRDYCFSLKKELQNFPFQIYYFHGKNYSKDDLIFNFKNFFSKEIAVYLVVFSGNCNQKSGDWILPDGNTFCFKEFLQICKENTSNASIIFISQSKIWKKFFNQQSLFRKFYAFLIEACFGSLIQKFIWKNLFISSINFTFWNTEKLN
ncbi:hypothetical protein M0811_12224 [Anaeramoeba ignava]|uniref:Transmembrane protein n=1 Tax=Anaeramoeba ignava TaxID=1746090 RepID=A0A9Q0R6Z9_ANAIG|nr:hypothetical protein M0811_12224 [Anaeramoeba ignava]